MQKDISLAVAKDKVAHFSTLPCVSAGSKRAPVRSVSWGKESILQYSKKIVYLPSRRIYYE